MPKFNVLGRKRGTDRHSLFIVEKNVEAKTAMDAMVAVSKRHPKLIILAYHDAEEVKYEGRTDMSKSE